MTTITQACAVDMHAVRTELNATATSEGPDRGTIV